jgi:3-phosphoinositide dependent protein kinase-1
MATTNDYNVGVTIGDGAYGHVVHAKHKATGRDVAIKVVEKIALQRKPHAMHCIWTERTVLQELKSSDYVVNLWASFHDSECVYLVMECGQGGDMSHLIRAGLESEHKDLWYQAIPYYGLQLVEALEFIHSRDVLHCDIKPDNILCTSKGRIQLADFACAIHMNSQSQSNTPENDVRFHGTADYASPEILRGGAPQGFSVAVDMWSLGCIFYQFFHGRSPFHTESDALSVKAVFDYANSTSHLVLLDSDLLNEAWKQLVSGLLRVDPAERLGSDRPSYSSVRSSKIWEKVDFNEVPSFLPPEPGWVSEARSTQMKDGSIGWAAFLL